MRQRRKGQGVGNAKLAAARQSRCACFAIKPSNLCLFAFVIGIVPFVWVIANRCCEGSRTSEVSGIW